MEHETYRVFVDYSIGDEERIRRFTTDVTITSDQPYTDISDTAHERLYDKFPDQDINILDTQEEDLPSEES